MQIEVGKYYRARDGRKVGPMTATRWPEVLGGRNVDGKNCIFNKSNGTHGDADSEDPVIHNNQAFDLIAEWQEGPVRTVTCKEIVRGWYGIVHVAKNGNVGVNTYSRNPTELRAAAATLIEIADALEEQKDD